MNLWQRLNRLRPGGDEAEDRALLPADWPLAVRAGVEPVVLGWGVVVLPTLAFYLAASSRDAAAALSLGGVLRTGTGLWSLGFGGAMGAADADYGTLSLPLLGLTLIQVWLTRSSVNRSQLSGPRAGAVSVIASTLTALLLVVLASPAASRTWSAVIGVAVLSAMVTAVCLQSAGRGWQAVAAWQEQLPAWVTVALRMVRELACVAGVLAVVVAGLALVLGAGRVSQLHDALAGGGLMTTAGLLLLQLGWVPTGLVWALSWLVGPGFTVGTGSVFSPTRVVAGAVPGLPLLGALPTGPVGAWGAFLPFLFAVAGAVVAWRHREELRELPLRYTALTVTSAALTLACG
ncbi:DUF6350 family protein, partial [Actinomyces sp. MRS3W]|uniref:cell division protein PerM n=1 Tax=Actinomyces sp. MRS3W TaxID=2800796 RepID=UPI0028FD1C82